MGLCNGARGKVYDVLLPVGFQRHLDFTGALQTPTQQDIPIVLVQFDPSVYRGSSFLANVPGIVALTAQPHPTHWLGQPFTRFQLPLRVCYALTIHKVQGATEDSIVVGLNGKLTRGMAYVALSRVRKLENLALLPTQMTLSSLNGAPEESDDMRKELKRLRQLSHAFLSPAAAA